MNDTEITTLAEVRTFLTSSIGLQFKGKRKEEVYEWIEDTLVKFEYFSVKKKHKSLIRKYLKKMTGYSKPQLNRIILQYKKTGKIVVAEYERHEFTTRYSEADIALLAKTDELHDFPNGALIKRAMERMWKIYGKKEYENISHISVMHIYNMRQSPAYLRLTKRYEKTKPHVVNIGIRKKPAPNGRPGYFRIDTVHQGDCTDGSKGRYEKGVYHIHFVDEVTQFDYVGAVEKISEAYLVPMLIRILEVCPFEIVGFHSDNGGEYVNHIVANLLNKLLIEFTKSRSRHSQDNALVEGKNNAIIRKWMGYGFISRHEALKINEFYFGCFHEYLNYHRSCGFAKDIEDSKKKGRIRKIYRYEDYKTPYEKLKSLTDWEQYLKKGVTAKDLEKIAMRKTDNEMAQEVQTNRYQLFSKLFPTSL
jgi:hypothetical protein